MNAVAALLAVGMSASVDSFPADTTLFRQTVLTTGLDSPVSMAIAPDGRIFVCEQGGRLRVIRNGVLADRPVLHVATAARGEEGLLGVACDPNFARNHYVYVLYTALEPNRHNRIVRYVMKDSAQSPRVIFDLDDHQGILHVGGALRFGRDGMLYIGSGDNDEPQLAQNMRSTFGKVLRIRADGTIPRDNPFYEVVSGSHRAIWARGFRNAFALDVEPRTRRIFVNDVGGDQAEEVDELVAGSNYGWPAFEGPGAAEGFRAPLHAYGHKFGCAITGGTFYAPARPLFPREWLGRYVYSDYCLSELRWLDPRRPATAHPFLRTRLPGPVDLRVGPDGALYALVRGNIVPTGGAHVPGGAVLRIAPRN
jgi:glucose/arabinose dehydrogenase